jgi:hypothetical protein
MVIYSLLVTNEVKPFSDKKVNDALTPEENRRMEEEYAKGPWGREYFLRAMERASGPLHYYEIGFRLLAQAHVQATTHQIFIKTWKI